jgi:hypothetical protein
MAPRETQRTSRQNWDMNLGSSKQIYKEILKYRDHTITPRNFRPLGPCAWPSVTMPSSRTAQSGSDSLPVTLARYFTFLVSEYNDHLSNCIGRSAEQEQQPSRSYVPTPWDSELGLHAAPLVSPVDHRCQPGSPLRRKSRAGSKRSNSSRRRRFARRAESLSRDHEAGRHG